jgi:hypothetical protein
MLSPAFTCYNSVIVREISVRFVIGRLLLKLCEFNLDYYWSNQACAGLVIIPGKLEHVKYLYMTENMNMTCTKLGFIISFRKKCIVLMMNKGRNKRWKCYGHLQNHLLCNMFSFTTEDKLNIKHNIFCYIIQLISSLLVAEEGFPCWWRNVCSIRVVWVVNELHRHRDIQREQLKILLVCVCVRACVHLKIHLMAVNILHLVIIWYLVLQSAIIQCGSL